MRVTEHYFTPSPATADDRRDLRVELAGAPRDLVTSRSVFSGGGVDKATAVLLDRLDQLPEVPAGGRVVDLGCGWGPIALTIALLHRDCEVWAVDVSQRARDLTAENARRLGLETVRVVAPEQVPSDLVADVLLSNPPVRIGKAALHALLAEWTGRLAPTGWAGLVVGRNLGADPLTAWLAAELPEREVGKAASAKGFRVIRISPRR